MKYKHQLYCEIICMILLSICVFFVGVLQGMNDADAIAAEKRAKLITEYDARITELEAELEEEKKIEHVVTTVEYVPLPVDYETDPFVDPTVLTMIAQVGIGEDAKIDERPEEVAAVMETIFNRVDSEDPYFPDTVPEVITQSGAYEGYSPNNPVDARYYAMACDTYWRHTLKLLGISDPGYVIPYDCLSFSNRGDNKNYFRDVYGNEVKVREDIY